MLKITFVGVEILLLFRLRNLHLLAHFFADDLLRDDLVAKVLLEVFERNSLLLRRLFQIFHRIQVHFLAHLIEPLDDLGIGGDAHVFAFIHQQVLIDEVAQHIFLLLGKFGLGLGAVFLLIFVEQLVGAALVVGAGDDVIVHARHNLFHHGVGGEQRQQYRGDEQKKGYAQLVH